MGVHQTNYRANLRFQPVILADRESIEHGEQEVCKRGRELLGRPLECMGRSQEKGYTPIIHAEMETILNKLQERLSAHENCLTGD